MFKLFFFVHSSIAHKRMLHCIFPWFTVHASRAPYFAQFEVISVKKSVLREELRRIVTYLFISVAHLRAYLPDKSAGPLPFIGKSQFACHTSIMLSMPLPLPFSFQDGICSRKQVSAVLPLADWYNFRYHQDCLFQHRLIQASAS